MIACLIEGQNTIPAEIDPPLDAFDVAVPNDERLQANREHPNAEPGPGEVLVKMAAVSLNYRDRLVAAPSARS